MLCGTRKCTCVLLRYSSEALTTISTSGIEGNQACDSCPRELKDERGAGLLLCLGSADGERGGENQQEDCGKPRPVRGLCLLLDVSLE